MYMQHTVYNFIISWDAIRITFVLCVNKVIDGTVVLINRMELLIDITPVCCEMQLE